MSTTYAGNYQDNPWFETQYSIALHAHFGTELGFPEVAPTSVPANGAFLAAMFPGWPMHAQKPVCMHMNQGLLATAYHEAGHVVIAEMLWIKTLGASIVPDKDTWGHVFMARIPKSIRLNSDISPGLRNRVDRRIMVSLAGHLAEQKFTEKKKPSGAQEDHRNAVDLADCLTGSIEETNAYIAWLLVRTCAAVELYYPIIEAVAANLYEHQTLTGNQLRECIRIARDKMVCEEPSAA